MTLGLPRDPHGTPWRSPSTDESTQPSDTGSRPIEDRSSRSLDSCTSVRSDGDRAARRVRNQAGRRTLRSITDRMSAIPPPVARRNTTVLNQLPPEMGTGLVEHGVEVVLAVAFSAVRLQVSTDPFQMTVNALSCRPTRKLVPCPRSCGFGAKLLPGPTFTSCVAECAVS